MKNIVDTFTRPLVSVIMPAYNVEAYIAQAIDSVLAQTYTEFEFLISDDASTDRTCDVVKCYADTRIKLIKQTKNLGYVGNMNTLLQAAQGNYIVIQDADDYSHETRLAVLVDYLDRYTDVDMLGSSYIKVTDEGQEEFSELMTDRYEIQKSFDEMNDPLPVLNGTLMFRRKIIECGILFRNLNYVNRGQDDDWLFRVSEQFTITNVASILYYYRSNSSSMTLNPAGINYKSICAADYVRFLKTKRVSGDGDLLDQGRWMEIELFFEQAKKRLTKNNSAYIESYIAHKYLSVGDRVNALKWLFKAVIKNTWNAFLWKKIIHVCIHN